MLSTPLPLGRISRRLACALSAFSATSALCGHLLAQDGVRGGGDLHPDRDAPVSLPALSGAGGPACPRQGPRAGFFAPPSRAAHPADFAVLPSKCVRTLGNP